MGAAAPTPQWSWAGAPAPLRGPPGPVAPPSAGLLRCARPWPPGGSLGRCGPCPAARPPLRAALPAWPPGPSGAAGPGSAPLRSLWVATWVAWASPGRLRPLRRVRRSPRPPPLRRRVGPAPGGSGSPWAAALSLRVWPPGSCPLLPPSGALRSCCRGAAPLLRPAGSPLGSPFGRPPFGLGRRRCVPPGGGWGRLRRPFSPPPPPSVGAIRRSCCCQGLRKWPPATLDNGPSA